MALEGDALQPREDCTAHVTRKHGTRRRQVFRLIVQTEVLTAPSDECQDDMQSFGHLGVVDGHLGEFRVEQALQRGEIERGVVPGQQIGLTKTFREAPSFRAGRKESCCQRAATAVSSLNRVH